ncbi:MAG: chaperone modulator CbpM [Flavobacteriales bacterium]|nr:chaperone modulator CbpM [Flavobacteriales bacterium]
MKTESLILIDDLCVHYEVEHTFFTRLDEMGLIQINVIENVQYIHTDLVVDLEKMIRLHHELEVNMEGIDVVFNLLRKMDEMNDELSILKSRLRFYEDQ